MGKASGWPRSSLGAAEAVADGERQAAVFVEIADGMGAMAARLFSRRMSPAVLRWCAMSVDGGWVGVGPKEQVAWACKPDWAQVVAPTRSAWSGRWRVGRSVEMAQAETKSESTVRKRLLW